MEDISQIALYALVIGGAILWAYISSKKQKNKKAIEDKRAKEITNIQENIFNAIINNEDISAAANQAINQSEKIDINPSQLDRVLITAWEESVNHFLEDGVLDSAERARLYEAIRTLDLENSDIDRNGVLGMLRASEVIEKLLLGITPTIEKPDDIYINLQKSESIIHVVRQVKYYEQITKRSYQGGSSSMSFRVAKGVYYSTGSFRGNPVETTEQKDMGTGNLIITTKHIYFEGGSKSFRVPYSKIVAYQNYANGLGIMRDAQTAKPQTFVTGPGTGWFIYNLITNVSELAG